MLNSIVNRNTINAHYLLSYINIGIDIELIIIKIEHIFQ